MNSHYSLPIGALVHLDNENGGYGVVVAIERRRNSLVGTAHILWFDDRWTEFDGPGPNGPLIQVGDPSWRIILACLPQAVLKKHQAHWEGLKDQRKAMDAELDRTFDRILQGGVEW